MVLHERGKDLVGSCPYCKEQPTKASFTISPTKNMYYCFNCCAAGNLIKFLMQIQDCLFADAVIDLASKCVVTIEFFFDEDINSNL